MIIGNGSPEICLDENANYLFEYARFRGTKYLSSGLFPLFKIIDRQGKVKCLKPTDESWKVTADCGESSARVRYASDDITVAVDYRLQGDASFFINVRVEEERGYKLIALSDGDGFIIVPLSPDNRKDSFLVIPRGRGGELIPFSGQSGKTYKRTCKCGWGGLYKKMGLDEFSVGSYANFLAVLNGKSGVILRPAQYSADFRYGERPLDNVQTLFISADINFRPRATTDFSMPLCHSELAFELTFVGDENGDGTVDWVDIGIAYRDKYIKKNRFSDEVIKNGMIMELDVNRWVESVDQFESKQEKVQVGDSFLKELWSIYDSRKYLYPQILEKCIKPLYFTPSGLKIVGAHVPRGLAFDQMWYRGPEPSYGSFPELKAAAVAYRCKVQAHMNIDDAYEGDLDYQTPSVPLRTDSEGRPLKGAIYGDRQGYIKDIPQMESTGEVYSWIDRQFADWGVKEGDSWHWDVFTTIAGTECYSTAHPATSAVDYQARLNILKYIAETKKVYLASEGFSEGIHEYCTMGCYPPLMAGNTAAEPFTHAISIPLIAVIFLGRGYYDAGCGILDDCVLDGEEHRLWKKSILPSFDNPEYLKPEIDMYQIRTPGLWARALLLGATFRALTNLPGIDAKKEMHFKHGVFYSHICELEIVDIDKNGTDWSVRYSDGSLLRVTGLDLSDLRSPAEGGRWNGTMVYEKDGIAYDGYSPVNCMGYFGVWREGKFNMRLPKGRYRLVEGHCKIESVTDLDTRTELTVDNKGLSVFLKEG